MLGDLFLLLHSLCAQPGGTKSEVKPRSAKHQTSGGPGKCKGAATESKGRSFRETGDPPPRRRQTQLCDGRSQGGRSAHGLDSEQMRTESQDSPCDRTTTCSMLEDQSRAPPFL